MFEPEAGLFSRRFREGISFPNFVETSVLKLSLSKVCALPSALQNRALFLGGHLGPEKNIYPPQPKKFPNSQKTPSQPLGPSRPAPLPLLGFLVKNRYPLQPSASDSPFPLPEQNKNKNYPKRPPSFEVERRSKRC